MFLEVANDERQCDTDGYYDGHRGLNQVRFCTRKYLRDLLRNFWEQARDHGETPYVCVHVTDEKGSCIHEGCKPAGWQTDLSGPELVEFFCCYQMVLCMDGKDHQFYRKFKINDIISVML